MNAQDDRYLAPLDFFLAPTDNIRIENPTRRHAPGIRSVARCLVCNEELRSKRKASNLRKSIEHREFSSQHRHMELSERARNFYIYQNSGTSK